MTRLLTIIALILTTIPMQAQRLPEGEFNPNRERTYDLLHCKAELSFNFAKQAVSGTATIQLTPLHSTQSIALDAVDLAVSSVTSSDKALDFRTEGNQLHIQLGEARSHDDTLTIAIDYTATPKAGMYFLSNPQNPDRYYISTYGEDGLHANWLPIYGDVNDQFSTEMIVTVPEPYVVISNGKLLETRTGTDNSKTFHWLQKLPHPNYLISLYVGDFEKGELQPALGDIPVNYWVPRGQLEEGAHAFRNTTRMVEFYSERFDYRYPWAKYDQIAVPDYAIGAMEHTTVTGHRASVLRTEVGPVDFSPTLDAYQNPWSAEATISHELAHHWFGDLVTCRNLSNIWLNESFATFLMFLWDEEALGENDYLFAVDLARQHYFDYVENEHIIRPLEYAYFDDANTIYNTEHTYYKGGAVLHMLRRILGDEPFYRALSYYLHQHEFGNVDSHDLKIAIEEATGENLHWFFDDWVRGGGHPTFEVRYDYLPSQQKLAVYVDQVQPIVEGQDLFTLPVDITIATSGRTWNESVRISEQSQRYLFDCEQRPLMVSFDGAGDLVAEVTFSKSATELAYQAKNDAVPGRLRAIRQLAAQHPGSRKTLDTFRSLLSSENFWAVQAEAALQLGTIRTATAEDLVSVPLQNDEYRVRKAAVLALPQFGTDTSREKLQQIIAQDEHMDVAATAIWALARSGAELSRDFLQQQLERDSWYDEIKLAVMRACEELKNKDLIPMIKKHADPKYNQFVHGAAIDAWAATAPEDKELHRKLIALTRSPVYTLQQDAIAKLGELYVSDATQRLEQLISENADANLVVAAKKALDKTKWTEAP